MKNVFCFTLKVLFSSSRYLNFCLIVYDYVGNKKVKVNFKMYDIFNRETNNYNTHISQMSQEVKAIWIFGQLIEYNISNIFLENYIQNVVKKLVPDPFKTEYISGSKV